MSNVEEIKSIIHKILENGPLQSGLLVKKVIEHGYYQNKDNGSNSGHLYSPDEISRAINELHYNDIIEYFESKGIIYYRLSA